MAVSFTTYNNGCFLHKGTIQWRIEAIPVATVKDSAMRDCIAFHIGNYIVSNLISIADYLIFLKILLLYVCLGITISALGSVSTI